MTEHALLTDLKGAATLTEDPPAPAASPRDADASRGSLEPQELQGGVPALDTALEQAFAENTTGNWIRMSLEVEPGATARELPPDFSLQGVVELEERQAIRFALARTNNNRARAARLLRISRALLYKRMHRYQIL